MLQVMAVGEIPLFIDVEEADRGRKFGLWLRGSLAAKGWNQTRLHQESGVSKMTISVLCRDGFDAQLNKIRRPDIPTIDKIARALKVDANEGLEAAGYAPRKYSMMVGSDVIDPSKSLNMVRESSVSFSHDPMLSYGVELDPSPYLYALSNVRPVAAGTSLTRAPLVDAPGEDLTHQWEVRAIRIVGTCMEPLLKDGEIALVLPPEAAEDGCVVTATVDLQHPVCKRVRITETASWLEPHNGEGIISEGRFVITGVVEHKIASMRPLRVKD
jgi:transcriptional regulator with XRE-family HTH domain